MICLITDYGARPGADVLQTLPIQSAIDACAAQGGGTVVIPAGTFRTGTLRLCSNLVLELEDGACLLGSGERQDYCELPFEGIPRINSEDRSDKVIALLWAFQAENITITGKGCIDFNGECFMHRSVPEGVSEAHCIPERDRPNRMIFLHCCSHVKVSGIRLVNSPAWTLVFSCSRDILAEKLFIKGSQTIPNNDGIHFSGCSGVSVADCDITAGDDCIAFTAITDFSSPMFHAEAKNCVLSSRSAAIRIGGRGGTFRDIFVHDCRIHDTNRGIVIFSMAAQVENIVLSDLDISARIYAGQWWGKGEPAALLALQDDGAIRQVTMKRLRSHAENPLLVCGNVSGLSLEESSFTLAAGKYRKEYGGKYDLSPYPAIPAYRGGALPWLYGYKVPAENIQISNVQFEADSDAEALLTDARFES